MERITSAQPPPCVPKHAPLDLADLPGMEIPIYMYKSRRGMKRGDDSKETYKLPHRLIEKKRRDRINECIAQLKDLLPEHLKLTTLGHLEKAVVLELTLKHVRTLSALLEQQQQKIVALQKDLRVGEHGGAAAHSSEEMFRSGFHLCANEVLQYVARQESSRDLSPSLVIGHIQKVAAEVLKRRGGQPPAEEEGEPPEEEPPAQPQRSTEGLAKNCVPVIQRTSGPGEQSGSDTDTDSGYGGEHDPKRDPKAQWSERYAKEGQLEQRAAQRAAVKQEGDGPRAKRARSEASEEDECPPGSAYLGFSANQPPFCLPFYLLPPSTAPMAAYLPMLEKCWYPGGMPVVYPGMGADALPSPLGDAASPVAHQEALDSPSLHKALKQAPPALSLEGRD